MRIKLLGASAGGGFPQWNCCCTNCRSLRQGKFAGKARTQSQLAVSADGKSWILLNASPDLRVQIENFPELHPQPKEKSGIRHTPIAGVVLTNADLDHVLGLLLMRESQPYSVHATASVRKILNEDNSMYRMLKQTDEQVRWVDIQPERPFELGGLNWTAYSTQASFPIYVKPERRSELSKDEAVLALVIEDPKTKKRLGYLPGIPALDETWLKRLSECDLVFCDGTFWTDDELQKLSGATRTSREMGHIPMSGAQGSVELLSKLTRPRKVFTHINNTNPVLNEAGPEFSAVKNAGIILGHDGMEFHL